MYKNITLEDMKQLLKLPKNYSVDAFIIYGSYLDREYKRKFLSALGKRKYKVEKLEDDFIEKILSVKVGKKRIWFCVEYGGTRLSEFVHFASMLGSKNNILVGTCGGLQKNAHKFSIIVPPFSYSTESSCHMYIRENKSNNFASSKKLNNKIIKLLTEKKMNVIYKPTVTCQAMMGETWNDIINWSNNGFYGVEMEASTVFAVSEHFNVPAAAIIQVADNLIEKEIVASETYLEKMPKLKKIRRTMFEVALDAVLKS